MQCAAYVSRLTAVQIHSSQPHLPATANAAYGISPEPLYRGHPMFHHPKTNTNVTAYAEAYAASMGGLNPFARHPLGVGK